MSDLLPDANIEGQFEILLSLPKSGQWSGLWDMLDVRTLTFADLGLSRDASDSELWWQCSGRNVLLVTANRNMDGTDSLESMIRNYGGASSLPVLTLANPDRILRDRDDAERTAARLLEVLFDIEQFRGVGRVFIP